jgi:ABC-type transport system involved in multi-copper enzyme maturation permease subunit
MATVTTSAEAPPLSALPPASGRAGLMGAMRSEWTKLRSVRSTYWTLIALVVVSVGLGAAISAGAASELNAHPFRKMGFDTTQISLFAFFELGQLVIAVLGAMVITSEYSTGMIRTSLTSQPRRGTVYAAKAVVFGLIALVVSFVVSFVAFFLGQALLSSTGIAATLSQPRVLQAVVGSALLVALVAMFSFGLGAIFRHTAAAITTAIGVVFVLPIIVNIMPESWQQDIVRWLPSSAGNVLTTTVGSPPPHYFSPWGQFAVTAAYAAAVLIIGAVLLRKRDA